MSDNIQYPGPECVRSSSRTSSLTQLLGVTDAEASELTIAGRFNIIRKLAAARQTEILRGKSGSWLYDVNRHLSLTKMLRVEKAALLAQMSGQGGASTSGFASAAFTTGPHAEAS